MIEQDHRKGKQRCYPMLGFKRFENAEATLSGNELVNKIKKGQFDTSEVTAREPWSHMCGRDRKKAGEMRIRLPISVTDRRLAPTFP
jgi:hypothetical protein